jgi:flagellar motor switch protein FliG
MAANTPAKQSELPGITKAALLLVSIEQEAAAKVLSLLDKDTIEQVSTAIATLGEQPPEERLTVVEEFYQLIKAKQYLEQGGLDYARQLLETSLSPAEADEILKAVEQSIRSTPFSFLKKAESSNLLTFIQDEHPQTIALVLAHLESKQAAEILAGLAAAKQLEVVRRIATMEHTNPDIVKEVERGLESRLAAIVVQRYEKTGGVSAVAEILNLADRATEKTLLEALEEEDPDLVENIRRLMFVFEDLILVNDKGIQQVLKEIDNEVLALALKTASDDLKDKIFRNMSERAATLIKEDMEYMGPVRLSDVEQAQQKIVDVVRRLEEAGEVIIQGRGGEGDIVV